MFERFEEFEVPIKIEFDTFVPLDAAETPPMKEALILQDRLPHSNPIKTD
jgi:hypothetical protein